MVAPDWPTSDGLALNQTDDSWCLAARFDHHQIAARRHWSVQVLHPNFRPEQLHGIRPAEANPSTD
jgi:hypothetical protein